MYTAICRVEKQGNRKETYRVKYSIIVSGTLWKSIKSPLPQSNTYKTLKIKIQ